MHRGRLLRVLVPLALAVGALVLLFGPEAAPSPADGLSLAPAGPPAAFETALEPVPLEFPADHGVHPAFQTEWWYFIGNLYASDGRRFGYQLTFFRRGLAPGFEQRSSAFAANHLYFAHLALTDVAAGKHRAYERFSRGSAGLAGAASRELAVFLEDWTVESVGDSLHLTAAEGELELRLTLTAGKPPVAHGRRGLSPKSERPGNASYYVSLTDLPTQGSLQVRGQRFEVRGTSWFDHEWGTSALGPDAVGWDWFGLQLDDGRELMLFQIRTRDGGVEPVSGGTLVDAAGGAYSLTLDQVSLRAIQSWRSPSSGAVYPVGWRIRIPGRGLDLQVTPALADQENRLAIVYWEGAVDVTGSHSGVGYLELTGYGSELEGLY